jgi:hypothetical protein
MQAMFAPGPPNVVLPPSAKEARPSSAFISFSATFSLGLRRSQLKENKLYTSNHFGLIAGIV